MQRPERGLFMRTVSDSPKVSVIIPTYNYARYLPAAIESVLAQDFSDFELLVSDDASTDDTASILAEYATRDPRLRVVVQPRNLGMVPHWNWCLQQARGEYVKFMFGDDCFASATALSALVQALDAAPRAALVASARVIIDESSRPTDLWNHFTTPGEHHGIGVIARCLREDRNLVGEPSAVLFRRRHAQRGFDPDLRQVVDLEFWFHLLLWGSFVYLPEPLCAFRQHRTQQTLVNRRADVGPKESLQILVRYLEFVSHPELGGFTATQRRHMLYRRLHYSRKNVARSAGIIAAEAQVRAALPQPWYGLHWTWHRLTKPLLNLRRFVLRHLRALRPEQNSAPAAALALARWPHSLQTVSTAPSSAES